jgi:hypothetical protein
VKAAHLRDRSHVPDFGRVRGRRIRRDFLKREVRPGFVAIRHERLHMPVQRSFVEDGHVVRTLAGNRTNHALHVSSLPERARLRGYFLSTRVLHLPAEVCPEDFIPIVQQVLRNLSKGEGLARLLWRPFRRRMSGNINMPDPSSVVRQDQQDVKNQRHYVRAAEW